jgi:hypothetical protein
MGSYAFAECKSTTVKIGSGLIDIASYAFRNSAIQRVYIRSTLNSFGSGAFDGCTINYGYTDGTLKTVWNGVFTNFKVAGHISSWGMSTSSETKGTIYRPGSGDWVQQSWSF